MCQSRNEKGFILVIVLSLLMLLAVTAMSLNVKSGLQVRMAGNGTANVQTYYDQLAVIEQSLWKLAGDFCWRVSAGENYVYHGRTYSRKVFTPNSATYPALAAYADAVIISVQAPGATGRVNKSFRYNIDTPFLIRTPRQVGLDSAGNIYFADVDNHSIWKIDNLSGAILRIAGNGTSGFSGDGGPATEAQLNYPRGVCVDAFGNVYIADTNNNCIRKVTSGFISTVVNTSGLNTDGGHPLGDGNAATAATLDTPFAVGTDESGNIYIADTNNHLIRKITIATGIITTVAGTTGGYAGDGGAATAAKLSSPCGVWVSSAGDVIYISDWGNDRIRKVITGGNISTVAGISSGYFGGYPPIGDGGLTTSAQLNNPYAVWLDAGGNMFIADSGNNRIRKVTAATGRISTIVDTTGVTGYAGDGGAATSAKIDWPTGLALKSTGEIIIADTNNSCLRQVNSTNTISTLPMTIGPALNTPNGAATYYDATQNKLFLYIADTGNHRIRKLDTTTNAIVTVAGTGTAGLWGDGAQATAAQLSNPSAVAVDAAGNLYIADTGNHEIRKVTAITGVISTVAGTGSSGSSGDGGGAPYAKINSPQGVFVDTAGTIFIADTGNHRIRKVTAGSISRVSGTSVGLAGDGGDAAGGGVKFNQPQGIWLDAAGNIFIADTNNHRIRKITASTNFINTVAGTNGGYSGDGGDATTAQLKNPQVVSVDQAGNIFIADTGNHAVRLVNSYTGKISTLAGTGTSGYNGDSKPAVAATLNSPEGLALGLTRGGGRIFIGDTGNNRVRMLSLKTVPEVYGP